MHTEFNQIRHPSARSGFSGSKIPSWSLKTMARLLRTGDPAATIDRLFTSRHVTDLQLIIAVAFLLLIVAFIVGLCFSIENQVQSQWQNIVSRKSSWVFIHIAFAAVVSFLTFFSSVFVIFGGIVAWAYQVGSARLGVVDLFACEIGTLCRVAAVADTVRRRIDKFNQGPSMETFGPPSSHASTFTSEENYFPVFESNTRDLQTLEARVVINITAFYTYMKVVRDSMRTLAEIRRQPTETIERSENTPITDSWHEAARNIIYMLFLGFESARHAIADLVEFEPERAERTIVILISELEAYQFLSNQFRDEQEMHHERLTLRGAEYRELVPKLCHEVEAGRASEKDRQTAISPDGRPPGTLQWEPAWRLLPELRSRFGAVTR